MSAWILSVVGFELVLLAYRALVQRHYDSLPEEDAGTEIEIPAWMRPFPRVWVWTHIPGIAVFAIPLTIYMAVRGRAGSISLWPMPTAAANVAVLIGLGYLARG